MRHMLVFDRLSMAKLRAKAPRRPRPFGRSSLLAQQSIDLLVLLADFHIDIFHFVGDVVDQIVLIVDFLKYDDIYIIIYIFDDDLLALCT